MVADIISDTVELPDPQNRQKPRKIKVQGSLRRDHLPASEVFSLHAWESQQRWLRRLANPLDDDLVEDFSYTIYTEDMPRDSQVFSTLGILVMSVLAEDYQILPPPTIGAKDPEYKQALEIAAFNRWCLETQLDESFKAVLAEVVEAMLQLGHKVVEQVYDWRTRKAEVGQQLALVGLLTRHALSTAFIVNAQGKYVGVVYTKRASSGGAVVYSDDDILPMAKFFIPTYRAKNGDKRGRSHMRAAYTDWWEKVNMVPEKMSYMARFAQPGLHETLGEGVPLEVEVRDVTTKELIRKDSMIVLNNAELTKMVGGAVKTSPYGSVLTVVEAKGDGKIFVDMETGNNRNIAKAILFQTLTTEEAKSMARAASSTHQDVFGILIAFIRDIVEWAGSQQILIPLTTYNYGEDKKHLAPILSLGNTQANDVPNMLRALAAAKSEDVIHWSQLPELWAKNNLPEANMEEWMKDVEFWRQRVKGGGGGVDSQEKNVGQDTQKPDRVPTEDQEGQ